MSIANVTNPNNFQASNALMRLRKRNAETGEWGDFVTNEQGFVQVRSGRGLVANSLLRKDEWERLDAAVVQAQSERLNAVARLKELGLVQGIDSIGVTLSQWNTGSQMTRAAVDISGQSAEDRDRVDYLLNSVPVPVIHKEFTIGDSLLRFVSAIFSRCQCRLADSVGAGPSTTSATSAR